MTKQEQADQLRLAADIIETGHPWEMCHATADIWHKGQTDVGQAVIHNWKIRPTLATPPDGRPLHNPDSLTADQVGVGKRLTVKGEQFNHTAEKWRLGEWTNTWNVAAYSPNVTYRLPLSVPWPELPCSKQIPA